MLRLDSVGWICLLARFRKRLSYTCTHHSRPFADLYRMANDTRAHWMTRMNHRVRSVTFCLVFITIGTHIHNMGYTPLVWWLLAAQFLLYPHLLYLAGKFSRHPVRTETCALLLDPFLMGVWLAGLGFPLWVTYVVSLGTLMSMGAFHAWRGMAAVAVALTLGAGLSVALVGLHFGPDTGLLTTGLCMAMLTAYLLMVAASAQSRAAKLRATKQRLSENEVALQHQLDENQTLQTQLTELANCDPLTGAFNRRYLDATLPRELARCQRNGQPLGLILIDIDHFKRVNDTHGHPAGDTVIKALANLLRSQSRQEDVVCRHGGEEFLIMLPATDLDTARLRAQAYRNDMEALTVYTAEDVEIRVTLSAGVATFPHHGTNEVDLIRNADKALYHAKTTGRNRVVVNCQNKGDTECLLHTPNCEECLVRLLV